MAALVATRAVAALSCHPCATVQISIAGPPPPWSADAPRAATPLERAAEEATRRRGVYTVLLSQEDGSWSFAGDGTLGDFAPPLAPLPLEKAPPLPARFPKGGDVEVPPHRLHAVTHGYGALPQGRRRGGAAA